jgi:hypothetical protein
MAKMKNSIFGHKKAHSAKYRPKKLRKSRENETPPLQKPRKGVFPSCCTGGKNSARLRKRRQNQGFCDTIKVAAASCRTKAKSGKMPLLL